MIKSLILEVVDQGWVCHSRANIPYINISLDRLQQLKFERYSKQKKGKKKCNPSGFTLLHHPPSSTIFSVL